MCYSKEILPSNWWTFERTPTTEGPIISMDWLGYSSVNRFDFLKSQFNDPYTRLGLGIGLHSVWLGNYKVVGETNGLKDNYSFQNINCNLPISISWIPYSWKNENTIGNIKIFYDFYFYNTSEYEELGFNFELEPKIQDIGLSIDLGSYIKLNFGHYYITTKNITTKKDVYYSTYLTGFKKSKWYLSVEILWGGTVGNINNSRTYGFVPLIREPIENAKIARENAKPKIYSINPEKAVSGSVVKIKGNNFRANENQTKVQFSNYEGEIVDLTDEDISVRVPGNAQAGNTVVQVKTSKGYSNEKNIFIIPSKPPMLSIKNIKFSDDSNDNILNADENGEIKFTISNAKGSGKAFGLKLIPELKNIENKNMDINYPKTVDIGDLEAGQEKQVVLPLKSGLDTPTGELVFNMKITEANDFAPNSFQIKIPTKKLDNPDLQLAKIEVDDTFYPDIADKLSVGNGNNIVEPGESVEVVATLLNKGEGETKDTNIQMISDSPDIILLSKSDFNIGNIHPGEWRDLEFAFSVKKNYKGSDILPIRMKIIDSRNRFNKEVPLNIKMKRAYPKTEIVDIKAKGIPKKEVVMPSFGDELLNIPKSKLKKNDGVAVVIGVQKYKNKDVPNVDFAIKDAQLFMDYLQNVMGYKKENILYLENPTKADFEKVFGTQENYKGQLYDYIKKNKSEIFIYYNGHGAPDLETKQAYFVPSDADPNYIKLGGYPLSIFYENLSKIPAKSITVVIDSCFSGRSDKGSIISKASPIMIEAQIPNSNKMNIFASAKGNEIASWYVEKRHSLFTYFFLKGLQGEADKNQDKIITSGELEEYLSENVPYYSRRLYGRNQTPIFTGDENEVIAKY